MKNGTKNPMKILMKILMNRNLLILNRMTRYLTICIPSLMNNLNCCLNFFCLVQSTVPDYWMEKLFFSEYRCSMN
jgi:hypothetical protein